MKGNKGKLFRDKTYSADTASGSVRAGGREEGAAMHRAEVRSAPPPGSPGQAARAHRGGERKIFRGKV